VNNILSAPRARAVSATCVDILLSLSPLWPSLKTSTVIKSPKKAVFIIIRNYKNIKKVKL
jgi:hypothetical protein